MSGGQWKQWHLFFSRRRRRVQPFVQYLQQMKHSCKGDDSDGEDRGGSDCDAAATTVTPVCPMMIDLTPFMQFGHRKPPSAGHSIQVP
jgi:hypothetical protein